ncbi:MAG TPA: class I SAM-dependent methyltransferase [Acidimicrobiales bacterium]|nr:class I SAM-dependent methyltransferase [Acidimicrobiales bacterium]
MSDELLAEQIAYYRARAPEYDRWWHRTHQYALPPDQQAGWLEEVGRLETMLGEWVPAGSRVLELAAGTGLWTVRLAARAEVVVAVDAAPETTAINRGRLADAGLASRVTYVEADLFRWEPRPDDTSSFDVVFFSFWLSHVPPERFDAFWQLVARALRPGGHAVLIDNRWWERSWPYGAERPTDPVQVRSDVSSGDEYRIVKVYWEPDELTERLATMGWSADITTTGRHFVAGTARPTG